MHSIYAGLQAGGGSQGTTLAELQAAAAIAASTAANTDINSVAGSKDTTLTKIFVGGLPYHTSDKTLHEYFEQFGEIEEAVVITDRQTQKSRGYGFVTMKERPAAERACKDPNPIIDGRKANVNLAYLGAKPRGNLQLSALAAPSLPLQLSQLFPQRAMGLPQMHAMYGQQALLNPALMGAMGGIPGAFPGFEYQALLAAQGGANNAAMAAAAASLNPALFQHHAAGVPVTSSAGGYDYSAALAAASSGYPYGNFAASPAYLQAQLAAATAQAQADHQRVPGV